MATIEHLDKQTPADFTAELRRMDDGMLAAQQCLQQGAVHAVSFLLAHGCTKETAIALLASLRTHAALMREETRRRGTKDLFPEDQTGFH